MSDYRVDVRLRNNRILHLIERSGYPSTLAFCRANELNYSTIVKLVSLKEPALRSDGSYREIVHRLADVLQCDPEDLFTERQARAEITPRAARLLDEREALALSDPEALAVTDGRDLDVEIDRRRLLAACLDNLPPRERRVIEARYLQGEATFSEVAAADSSLSPQRAGQLEQRAMERMRKHLQLTHGITDAKCLASF